MERKNMWVCERCLQAIISHEGKQTTIKHDIELEFDEHEFEQASKCDFCEENEFSELYEII